MNIPKNRRAFEIGMVCFTGLGKLLFMDLLNLKLPFILFVILFWLSYFLYRTRKQKELYTYWGLSFSTAKPLMKIIAILGLVVATGIVTYGLFIKPIHWNIHILFVLLVYPIWGLIQQFLMMSLFAGNLKDWPNSKLNLIWITIFTSILFSIVHYPSPQLMVATFLMALVYTPLFLKYRNILPLGLFHGVIGGLFYFVILNRDAWVEFVSKYM